MQSYRMRTLVTGRMVLMVILGGRDERTELLPPWLLEVKGPLSLMQCSGLLLRISHRTILIRPCRERLVPHTTVRWGQQ